MNELIKSVEVFIKWKSHRDTVKRLFLLDVNGEQEYKERMTTYQEAIKKYSKIKDLEYIPAIIAMSKKLEGMSELFLLAAGYELLENK